MASLKWTKYGEGVSPLWVADMDFKAPQPVIDALKVGLVVVVVVVVVAVVLSRPMMTMVKIVL